MPAIGEITRLLCRDSRSQALSGPAAVFVTLPLISLIAHVGILHYVYDVDYFGAMAAPALLGLAIILKRATSPSLDTRRQLAVLRALLPAAAVMVSLNNPHLLTFSLHPISSIVVTPTLLTAAAAYLTYVYSFLMPMAPWFIGGGVLFALNYLFGPSVDTVQRVSWNGWNRLLAATDWMVPKTLTQWGVVSVLASFFFLILGAAISLARHRPLIDPAENV